MTVNTREQLFLKKIADAQAIGIELPESLAMLTRDFKTSKVLPDALSRSNQGKEGKLTRYASTEKGESKVDECIVESIDLDDLKKGEKQPRSHKTNSKLLFNLPSDEDDF